MNSPLPNAAGTFQASESLPEFFDLSSASDASDPLRPSLKFSASWMLAFLLFLLSDCSFPGFFLQLFLH